MFYEKNSVKDSSLRVVLRRTPLSVDKATAADHRWRKLATIRCKRGSISSGRGACEHSQANPDLVVPLTSTINSWMTKSMRENCFYLHCLKHLRISAADLQCWRSSLASALKQFHSFVTSHDHSQLHPPTQEIESLNQQLVFVSVVQKSLAIVATALVNSSTP